jgi:hypothetical protein
MRFRSQLMEALEESVGVDNALAVAELGDLHLGVISEGDGIALVARGAAGWDSLSRHEYFWGAMRHVAAYADERRETIPTEDPMDPAPVVVLPASASYKGLFMTTDGVAMAYEDLEPPHSIHVDGDRWGSFAEAVSELALEAEIFG